jgi:hypothetical protein
MLYSTGNSTCAGIIQVRSNFSLVDWPDYNAGGVACTVDRVCNDSSGWMLTHISSPAGRPVAGWDRGGDCPRESIPCNFLRTFLAKSRRQRRAAAPSMEMIRLIRITNLKESSERKVFKTRITNKSSSHQISGWFISVWDDMNHLGSWISISKKTRIIHDSAVCLHAYGLTEVASKHCLLHYWARWRGIHRNTICVLS